MSNIVFNRHKTPSVLALNHPGINIHNNPNQRIKYKKLNSFG